MGFSRQEYGSGLPCPPPGDLPHPRLRPTSPAAPALQAGSLWLSHQGSPRVNGTPPDSCPPRTCEWNLIWRQGLCRCSQVRMRPSCLALIPIRLMSLQGETILDTGRRPCGDGAESVETWPQAQEACIAGTTRSWKKPGAGSPSEPPRSTNPTLILNFWHPDM